MHNHQDEAEESADVAGKEPTIKEPINACFLIIFPIPHRTHPPMWRIVARQTIDKQSGRVDEVDGHR